MKVHQIMTAHARCVGPDNTLVEAAGLMREMDVGALPVCDNDRLAGMVTDRDIVLRGTADGRDPNTATVRDVMSQGIIYVFADQEVEDVRRVMEEKKVRRLPVLNREKRLVGIVSLGDIAMSSNPAFSGHALREVSEPAQPTARQRRLAEASEGSRAMPEVSGTPRRPARKQQRSRTRGSTGGGARRTKSSRASGAKRRGSSATTRRGTTRRGSARTGRGRKATAK